MKTDNWKIIKGASDYVVNEEGTIAEVIIKGKFGKRCKKLVTPKFDANKNSLYVRIRADDGCVRRFYVKNIVANAFLPFRGSDRKYIYFRDGDHKNCSVSNMVLMNVYEFHNVVVKANIEDPKSSLTCFRIVIDKKTKKRYVGYKMAADDLGGEWTSAGIANDATKNKNRFYIEYKEF